VWGDGAGGKLGLGDHTDQPTPVAPPGVSAALLAAGTNHGGALATTGGLLLWGNNPSGEVGNGTTVAALSPRP
jgi:alpha-tubulin suppressor-like RCC1 family protein